MSEIDISSIWKIWFNSWHLSLYIRKISIICNYNFDINFLIYYLDDWDKLGYMKYFGDIPNLSNSILSESCIKYYNNYIKGN